MKILLAIFAILCLSPLWFLFSGSFLQASMMIVMPPQLFPTNPVLNNYIWAFSFKEIWVWAGNSLLMATITPIVSCYVSITAGYAFSVYKFKYKKTIWTMLLFGLMIPHIAIIIPMFVIVSKIGLSGSIAAAMLPLLFVPTSIYLARAFFDQVPKSLIESARMDGASEFTILRKIIAPISTPLITALMLFSSSSALQDWIWQSLQLQDTSSITLLVGWTREMMIRGSNMGFPNPIGHSLATGVLLLIPLLIIFSLANKYFTDIGSMVGSIKD